jgi:hypothetical protein
VYGFPHLRHFLAAFSEPVWKMAHSCDRNETNREHTVHEEATSLARVQ